MKLTAKEKKRVAEIRKTETVVDWDPDFKLQDKITFDGEQFEKWTESMVPLVSKLKVVSKCTTDEVVEKGIKVGKDTYLYRRKLPMDQTITPGFMSWRTKPWVERLGLKIWAPGKRVGYAYFDQPVSTIILAKITDLDRPWMGLTPNEVLTQRAGIRRAKGHVLVGGLGLGWFAREVLARKQVKHVTVVELNGPLVKKLGNKLMKDYPGRVTVLTGDVWEHLKEQDNYDSYLFDIWPGWPDAHYDRTFQQFKQDHPGKVWGWGDCATYPIERNSGW